LLKTAGTTAPAVRVLLLVVVVGVHVDQRLDHVCPAITLVRTPVPARAVGPAGTMARTCVHMLPQLLVVHTPVVIHVQHNQTVVGALRQDSVCLGLTAVRPMSRAPRGRIPLTIVTKPCAVTMHCAPRAPALLTVIGVVAMRLVPILHGIAADWSSELVVRVLELNRVK